MSLAWREQLSVGNDVIDADHKHLIGIINQAEIALKVKDLHALTDTLNSLQRYSKVHFVTEEKIAKAVGFGNTGQLNESHMALLARLEQLKNEIGETWTDAAAEHFSGFLRDWLVNHVIKEDMLMKPFLKQFPPRFDPH